MSDFFGALELELRAAANRRPRRPVSVGQGLGAVAAAALVAAAVAVVFAVSDGGGGDSAQLTSGPKLDPVGTVIPKGEGRPPRSQRSVVVATGRTRVAGPWQLEIQPSERLVYKGEVLQPAGLRCITLWLVDPPATKSPRGIHGPTGSGYCGPQPRTPGFTRGQVSVDTGQVIPGTRRLEVEQVLIYGRAPERAAYVSLSVPNTPTMRAPVFDGPKNMRGDYYVVAVRPYLGPGARINWLDEDMQPGSRGTALLPPVTGKPRR
jgi:hypothetical protein